MESFIDLFIKELLSKNRDLSNHCVVFPTRRAGLIFKKKFSEHISKPVWLPDVYSIDDFFSFLSPFRVADSLHLLMELFTVYRNYFPQAIFEKYYAWGEMLLKDFNEVDLQMVDAEKLFSQVISLKEIDMLVGVSEEESERIRSFWKLFSDQEISRLKSAFLHNWKTLPFLYNRFRNQLQAKGIAYSGMAARLVTEKVIKNEISIPWDQIYFAGFYALSNSEKRIMNFLVDQKKAEIFWDADEYYVGNKKQEAGKYFRKNQIHSADGSFNWTFDYFKNKTRNIHFLGIPLNAGQAKYAGALLQNMMDAFSNADHTAVVLPDEKLLMPVLYSLPANAGPVNVTMGYPLSGSPVDEFIRTIKIFKERILNRKRAIPVEALLTFFQNKFIAALDSFLINNLVRDLKKENKYSVELDFLDRYESAGALKKIISLMFKDSSVNELLSEILQLLLNHFRTHKNYVNKTDFTLLKYFYEEVSKLTRLINEYKEIEFNETTLWKLIFDLLKSLRVPFTGEPVGGLQIMGFLETRNLDFENLLILSVNEDVMPGTTIGNSYIPFAIRKAYGLPTFEEQDAIYAYHFYRLLQRSENTWLFYNTEAGGLSAGEMSRYLLQIAYELKKYAGEKIKLTHHLIGTDLQTVEISKIAIKKNQSLTNKLKSFFYLDGTRKEWSATAFTTYNNCSLQFYFKYIAGLPEPDEIKEEIDPAVFGNIMHLVMQQFYQDQKTVTSEYIDSLFPLAAQAVDDAIRKEFPSSPEKLTGKNSLLKTVMTNLVNKILLRDKAEAPFSIEALESNFKHELKIESKTVLLQGKIDRVDEHHGVTRIIDYKTGKDKAAKKFTADDLFKGPEQKATFQLMLYALLYKKNQLNKKVKAGIYSLKTMSNGIDYLNDGGEISDEQLLDFENRLKQLISEITNPEIDFAQTDEKKRCGFCTYKDICNR
jgi:RecB family exonuclease